MYGETGQAGLEWLKLVTQTEKDRRQKQMVSSVQIE
jgi:hypothetical protein